MDHRGIMWWANAFVTHKGAIFFSWWERTLANKWFWTYEWLIRTSGLKLRTFKSWGPSFIRSYWVIIFDEVMWEKICGLVKLLSAPRSHFAKFSPGRILFKGILKTKCLSQTVQQIKPTIASSKVKQWYSDGNISRESFSLNINDITDEPKTRKSDEDERPWRGQRGRRGQSAAQTDGTETGSGFKLHL